MKKIRAIIADDEPDALEVLRNILTDTNKAEVIQEISNPHKIESAINKHKPDVLFLDIEMPRQNGLSLLKNIREYNQELPVIYVTAFDKYMKDAIKLNVYSYLLKPVDRLEINNLIDRLVEHIKTKEVCRNQKIKLPIKGGYVYLNPQDLLMLEAEGNYTRLKTVNGEEFMSSYNMGRLFDKLPASFFRINRGCILNGDFIYKINKSNNTCLARTNDTVMEFEVSGAFITEFNKNIK